LLGAHIHPMFRKAKYICRWHCRFAKKRAGHTMRDANE